MFAYQPKPIHLQLGSAFYDPIKPAKFPKHILRYRNDVAAGNIGLQTLSDADFIRHFGAPGGQEFHHYRVNGGGHDWFGAWGNQDIDSTELIWEFFSSACEESTNSIAAGTPSTVVAKKVIRVMDLMGRTTEIEPNRLQLYIYSDGSVEKRIQLN